MGNNHNIHDVKNQVKVYIIVFAALAVLTITTVAASYLDLGTGEAFLLALTIATVKGTLVAGYFMHLFKEKTIVLSILALTFIFLLLVLFLPYMAATDQAMI